MLSRFLKPTYPHLLKTLRPLPKLLNTQISNYVEVSYLSPRKPPRKFLCVVIVPQAEKWVIERFGRFHKMLDSGIHLLWPLIDKIAYAHSTKEVALNISDQTAITKDNVQIGINGIVYIKVTDPIKASYNVQDPVFAIISLAQTTMRAEIGKITLDNTFAERQLLNQNIVDALGRVASEWGISILRYEIKDIKVPDQIRAAMELEAEAERKKRKQILESEAQRESDQNVAEGKKIATMLTSEALMIEEQNIAKGEAYAIKARAEAKAEAIRTIAKAIQEVGGEKAVAYNVAHQYVQAFGNLAKKGNTVIVPANVNDSAGMVAQALSIFDTIYNKKDQQKQPKITESQALEKLVNELEKDKSLAPKLKKANRAVVKDSENH